MSTIKILAWVHQNSNYHCKQTNKSRVFTTVKNSQQRQNTTKLKQTWQKTTVHSNAKVVPFIIQSFTFSSADLKPNEEHSHTIPESSVLPMSPKHLLAIKFIAFWMNETWSLHCPSISNPPYLHRFTYLPLSLHILFIPTLFLPPKHSPLSFFSSHGSINAHV